MTSFIENAFKISGQSLYIKLVYPDLDMPICKKHRLMEDDVRVMGWPNRKGCFSVRVIGGLLDVAYYPGHEPRDIDQSALDNALYEMFPNEPGWGFAALDSMRKLGVDTKVMRAQKLSKELVRGI